MEPAITLTATVGLGAMQNANAIMTLQRGRIVDLEMTSKCTADEALRLAYLMESEPQA